MVQFQKGIFNAKTDYTSMIISTSHTLQFYDLPYPNHQGECSIPGSLYTDRVAPLQSMIGLGRSSNIRQTRYSLGIV